MATTIYQVLDQLREVSRSEADKGSRLERLIKAYLLLDPVYAEQFSNVWLWASGRAVVGRRRADWRSSGRPGCLDGSRVLRESPPARATADELLFA